MVLYPALNVQVFFVFAVYERDLTGLEPDGSCLGESNSLNLNVDTLGQGFDSNTATSGLVSEPLLVFGVHLLKRNS
jgi:hypothetical protein